MSEVEKMYENAGIKKKRYCEYDSDNCPYMFGHLCSDCGAEMKPEKYLYPPFTAEKQLKIENVILQNKKNYNKWLEHNINVHGEWVIRFVRTDKFAPYITLERIRAEALTRAEALAKVINHLWQDLTESERAEIKNILESEVRE